MKNLPLHYRSGRSLLVIGFRSSHYNRINFVLQLASNSNVLNRATDPSPRLNPLLTTTWDDKITSNFPRGKIFDSKKRKKGKEKQQRIQREEHWTTSDRSCLQKRSKQRGGGAIGRKNDRGRRRRKFVKSGL